MKNYQLKAGLSILGIGCAGVVNAQTKSPNVIVIYTDDHGTLDLNCYGAEDLYTPNADLLASQGVKFTQFYAAPVSSASRACLMTGQFALRAGLTGNAGLRGLPTDRRTLAEEMRDAGYRTACIGKWHMGSLPEYAPNSRGFDYFWGFLGGCVDSYSHFYYWWGPNVHDLWRNTTEIYEPGKFLLAETFREAKTFIKEGNQDQPFFLYWAVNVPHYPLQPTEKWLEYYSHLENPRRMYAAYVSTFDEYLGMLMTFLEKEGYDENTIVIFQSDNGHSTEVRTFGGGGWCGDYRGGKFSLFEGGIRVPAVIRWTSHLPSAEQRDQMVSNADWYPTIMELCGIDYDGSALDGKSLVPVIRNADAESPHDVLHFDFNDQWAVRKGDWKLLWNAIDVKPDDKNETIEGAFLSNLRMDPTERTDYSKQYPEKVRELQKERDRYTRSVQ